MKLFRKPQIVSEEIIKKVYKRLRTQRWLQLIVGLIIMAFSFNLFFLPSKLVFGGIGGLSILMQETLEINPIKFIAIGSALSLILGYLFLSKEKTNESVVASFLYPLFIYITSFYSLNIDLSNQLLVALLGGVLYGLGLGLVMKVGFATGGTDIIKQILNKYYKISMSNAMLLIDTIIIGVSSIFLGLTSAMYALVALYIINIIVEKIVLGISDSKVFYVITNETERVRKYIVEELKYNVTILEGRGGFSKTKKEVLFAIIPTNKYFLLKEGLQEIDPEAIVLITDAYHASGGHNEAQD